MRNIRFTAVIAALALAIPLAACGSDPAPTEHGEEGAEAEKGPNGGRLLKDGDFAVEVTVLFFSVLVVAVGIVRLLRGGR